ncbi:tRNA(His) guanylyltransferase Thg1 family protein [Photobacterium leiognathi subsp. mandapamensis]
MKDINLINDLCAQHKCFKDIENESATVVTTPENHYLVVRLDGINLSRIYLKNDIVNKKFKMILAKAVQQTYYRLHRKSPTNAQQIFLAAFMASDEVSFILNTYDNYYDDRILKIVTTLASTLSFLFTKEGIHHSLESEHTIYGAFDGKPLILKDKQQVKDYIAYRSAIYYRNTMGKELRLNGVSDNELYNEHNHNNLSYYQSKYQELNLNIESMKKSCTVFVPCIDDDKKLKPIKNRSLVKLIELYSNSIDKFENYLADRNQ